MWKQVMDKARDLTKLIIRLISVNGNMSNSNSRKQTHEIYSSLHSLTTRWLKQGQRSQEIMIFAFPAEAHNVLSQCMLDVHKLQSQPQYPRQPNLMSLLQEIEEPPTSPPLNESLQMRARSKPQGNISDFTGEVFQFNLSMTPAKKASLIENSRHSLEDCHKHKKQSPEKLSRSELPQLVIAHEKTRRTKHTAFVYVNVNILQKIDKKFLGSLFQVETLREPENILNVKQSTGQRRSVVVIEIQFKEYPSSDTLCLTLNKNISCYRQKRSKLVTKIFVPITKNISLSYSSPTSE